MANFLRKTAERIGKAIPNEVSKLNSFSKYIPYPYKLIPQGISSYDSAATAYGDTGELGTTFQAGVKPFLGASQDPGQYGSGYARTGKPTPNKDIFNTIGGIGNLLAMFKGSQSLAGGTNQSFLTPEQLQYQNKQNGIGTGTYNQFLSPDELQRQNTLNSFFDISSMFQAQEEKQNETNRMMREMSKLYSDYLFSQNQAAINPSEDNGYFLGSFSQNVNLRPGARL